MTKAYLRFGRLPKIGIRTIGRPGSAAYLTDAEEAAAKKKASDEAETTKGAILKELNTIKGALEENLKKKAAEQEKNLDDKLVEVNKAIEELKKAEPTVTVEQFKEVQNKLDVTIKAFDLLQTKVKNEARTHAGTQKEDESLGAQIVKAMFGCKEDIMSGKIVGKSKDAQMTLKSVGADMTVVTNVSTGVVPNTYRPGIIPVPFEMVHMRDIVNITPSETDSYHFFRHVIGNGTIAFQGGENNLKNEFDEDLNEQTVNLDYLAGFLRISRKMLRNFVALQAYLSRWLPEKYYEAEDIKAYQSLVANITGIQDTSGTDIISIIIRTIGKQKTAKYNVTGIVLNGDIWAKILTYKASTSGEFTQPIGVVTISPSGQLLICGIPVYTASWVAADTALIGDWRFFEIIQSEALNLGFFEQDGTNVQQNKITVRIEASVGFATLDPKAFVNAALTSVS